MQHASHFSEDHEGWKSILAGYPSKKHFVLWEGTSSWPALLKRALLSTAVGHVQAPEPKAAQEPHGASGMRIPDSATSIDLRGKGLQHVPDQVWASAAVIQRLDLASNALRALPQGELAACTALQVRQQSLFLPMKFFTGSFWLSRGL